MEFQRTDADFESDGTRCAAWHYRPDVESAPVVVMAHGFGAERSWALPDYAERFAERGYAVLLFDYRSFGDSDGDPRQLVSPRRHLADWRAAVDHARSLAGVDADRVALWGSSFSGGHAITTAARDDGVGAVVAQVPFVDGLRTSLHLLRHGGLDWARSVTAAVLADAARIVTRRDPYYVPIAGDPDEFAVLNTADTLAGYRSIVPDGERFRNECAARILATVPFYRPVAEADAVDCPVLVAAAEDDTIIPSSSVDAAVRALDDVERVRYPIGHFDAYSGEPFEEIVARQGSFLDRHLGT